MERHDFEMLRDLPGKVIHGDIRLVPRRQTHPALVADGILIENDTHTVLRLNISYNPEVGSKSFNVTAVGIGPICRLDVDGPAHRPAGRSHKHSLQTERCPDRNLPSQIQDMPELDGRSLTDLFTVFCAMANITHHGEFHRPDA